MANTTIRLKKSGVVSNVPVSLELGELALNYADGKLYYKNSGGVITYISSGATTNSFATINSNSSLILATSNTDILSLGGANGISINTDTLNKVITIDGSTLSSRISQIYDIDAQQNASILSLTSVASDAYTLANTANNKATSATTLAQSAYDYANTLTGGGSSTTFFNYLTVEKQLYTANASQTNFFAHYTPPYVTVVINGATVDSSEYSTGTANTIILNNATSAGDVVDITGFYQANSSILTSTFQTNTLSTYNYIATAGQTSFGGLDTGSKILSYVPDNLFTTLNGITLKNGVDYTASNGAYINLTFNAAANDEIVVYTFGAFNVINTYTKTEVDTLIASSSTAGKTLAINFFRS